MGNINCGETDKVIDPNFLDQSMNTVGVVGLSSNLSERQFRYTSMAKTK